MPANVPPVRLSQPAFFVRYALPLILYAGLIYFLSAQPHLPLPQGKPWLSTYAHFFEYLGFGLFMGRGLYGYGLSLKRASLIGVLVCSLYGATDEYHQRYTPNRVPDVNDWMADTLGATVGCTLWFVTMRRR